MLTSVDIVFTIASNDNATVTSTLRVPAPELPSGLEAQWNAAMAQLADHLRGLILATES